MTGDEFVSPGIYAIVNFDRGLHYIGSAVNLEKRWREHRNKMRAGKHENHKLQAAWSMYVEEEFHFVVLEHVADKATLVRSEQEWLDKSCKAIAMNIATRASSTLGVRHSDETRRLMSESRRGRKMPPRSEEHKRRLAAARKGRKFGPQSAISRARKSTAMAGNSNALGCSRSPETRARMSAAQRKRFADAS